MCLYLWLVAFWRNARYLVSVEMLYFLVDSYAFTSSNTMAVYDIDLQSLGTDQLLLNMDIALTISISGYLGSIVTRQLIITCINMEDPIYFFHYEVRLCMDTFSNYIFMLFWDIRGFWKKV